LHKFQRATMVLGRHMLLKTINQWQRHCQQGFVDREQATKVWAHWLHRRQLAAWSLWRSWPTKKRPFGSLYYFHTTTLMFLRLSSIRMQGRALALWRKFNSSLNLVKEAKADLERMHHDEDQSGALTKRINTLEELLAAQQMQTSLLSESMEAELRMKDMLREEFESSVVQTLSAVTRHFGEFVQVAMPEKPHPNSTKLERMLLELLKARKLIGIEPTPPLQQSLGSPLYVPPAYSKIPNTSAGIVGTSEQARINKMNYLIGQIGLDELWNYSTYAKSTDDESNISPGEEANLRAIVIEMCHHYSRNRRKQV